MFKAAIDPQKLEAFLEINQRLNSQSFDLNGLFTQILESATRLTDGDASSLLLLQPGSERLEFVVALGSKGEEVKSFVVPKGEGIAGWVAEHNTSIHVPDVARDPRFFSKISQSVGFQTQSILAVPLRVKGACVGVLEMINKKNGATFTEEDMTWLEVFANQAGLAIQNARSVLAMKEEILTLKSVLETKSKTLLTRNPRMQDILDLCRKYAAADSPVLITGENGTGKERIAEFIHEQSPRRSGPFIRLNCAAVPETLLEAELFGSVRGAFTDSQTDRAGHFESAEGGTLFLDEIGAVPVAVQSKLLRVLQTKTVERLGENRPRTLDVRIIAATNVRLEQAIDQGLFRQDLFYRLNVLPVLVPPLRQRPEDIPVLADFFLSALSAKFQKNVTGFSHEALDLLCRYSWPGNVRQLQNTVERAVVLSRGTELGVEALDLPDDGEGGAPETDLKAALQGFKARLIEKSLRQNDGNQTRTARHLGIQRTYLSKLIRELNIDVMEKGASHVS